MFSNQPPRSFGKRLSPENYDLLWQTILQSLPPDEQGMAWDDLCHAIAPELPNDAFPHIGTVRWGTHLIQRELEARGLVERVPASRPMRLRLKLSA